MSDIRAAAAAVAAALALAAAPALDARDVYVDAAGGDDATGDGSPARPYRSLTRALGEPLTSGDHVRAAAGAYSAATTGESFPLALAEGVSLHGMPGGATVLTGPASGDTLRATTGSPLGIFWLVEDLVLEGQGAATPTTGILLVPGRGQGPVVQRTAVRRFGRGIACELSLAGAPPQSLDSRAFIDSCRIEGNGVGLLISIAMQSTPGRVRERSEISNNVLLGNGTGVRIEGACTGCDRSGLDLGNPLHNNTIVGSTGDAVLLQNGDCTGMATNSPDLTNNAVVTSGGRGLVWDACVNPNPIETNDVWGNAGGGNGPFAGWPGNLSVDPGFADVAAGDVHLATGSPLVDAGTLLAEPLTDFEGDVRPLDGDGDQVAAFDIGADERNPASGVTLRRGVLTALLPRPSPAIAVFFPFSAANPLTPVLLVDLAPGAVDPTPGILTDTRFPLALYQHDGPAVLALLAVKRAAADTLAFDLR